MSGYRGKGPHSGGTACAGDSTQAGEGAGDVARRVSGVLWSNTGRAHTEDTAGADRPPSSQNIQEQHNAGASLDDECAE